MPDPLRFLVDVGVGRGVERALTTDGHDVASVRDRDPRMADDAILDWAVADGRIVVTMDRDFGALVFQSANPQAGVLLLRMLDAASAEKAATALEIVREHGDELVGAFAVFKQGQLRIRQP